MDSDAPNTAMAETRASPTMRAEAVCAVRRGLRMEFSRPSFPGTPRTRASGPPDDAGQGPGHRGAKHGGTDEDGDGPGAHQGNGRLGEAEGQEGPPDHGDRRTRRTVPAETSLPRSAVG